MAEPARAEGAEELGESELEESGPRRRPEATAEVGLERPMEGMAGLEEVELEELEVPEWMPPRRPSSVPPPPPSPRPSVVPRTGDRVDLDAVLRAVDRWVPTPSAPATPSATSTARRPRTRPSWGLCAGLVASALGVGMVGARIVGPSALPLEPPPRLAPEPEAPPARMPEPPAEVSEAHPPAVLEPAEGSMRRAPEGGSPARVMRARARARPAARREARRGAGTSGSDEPDVARGPEDEAPRAHEEPSALPPQPSRADVEHAVAAVLQDVRACAPGGGLAHLDLRFGSTGRVTTAQVDAPFVTAEQRTCVARAARAAVVPPFSSPRFHARYPVQL